MPLQSIVSEEQLRAEAEAEAREMIASSALREPSRRVAAAEADRNAARGHMEAAGAKAAEARELRGRLLKRAIAGELVGDEEILNARLEVPRQRLAARFWQDVLFAHELTVQAARSAFDRAKTASQQPVLNRAIHRRIAAAAAIERAAGAPGRREDQAAMAAAKLEFDRAEALFDWLRRNGRLIQNLDVPKRPMTEVMEQKFWEAFERRGGLLVGKAA